MSQLADHLTKESVHQLHEAFINGALHLQEIAERNRTKEAGLTYGNFDELGPPILKWVHHLLWASGSDNNTGELSGYPRVTRKSVASVLLADGLTSNLPGKADMAHTRLNGDITRALQASGLAKYFYGKWYLKPWSNHNLRYMSSNEFTKWRKRDARAEKRIAEEKAKTEKVVVVKRDLRSIRLPKSNDPEEIMAFVERFIPAALAIQDELEELKTKLASKDWDRVADGIRAALGGTNVSR